MTATISFMAWERYNTKVQPYRKRMIQPVSHNVYFASYTVQPLYSSVLELIIYSYLIFVFLDFLSPRLPVHCPGLPYVYGQVCYDYVAYKNRT